MEIIWRANRRLLFLRRIVQYMTVVLGDVLYREFWLLLRSKVVGVLRLGEEMDFSGLWWGMVGRLRYLGGSGIKNQSWKGLGIRSDELAAGLMALSSGLPTVSSFYFMNFINF